LSDIETGNTVAPSSAIITDIARVLNVSADFLLGLCDEPDRGGRSHIALPTPRQEQQKQIIRLEGGMPSAESDIDKLIQVDTDNILVTKKIYREYSPQLFEALEEAVQIFKTFARAYGQEALDHDDVRLVNECGLKLGVPDGEALFTTLYA